MVTKPKASKDIKFHRYTVRHGIYVKRLDDMGNPDLDRWVNWLKVCPEIKLKK